MMEYIIAAVVLAVAVGAYFYMKRKEEKEPEAEKWPWEQPKPKRPNQPPPRVVSDEEKFVEVYAPPLVEDGGWPIEIEKEFGEPLAKRPQDGIDGWEYIHTRVATLAHTIVRWRNPESGLVQWVDYPPQGTEDKDAYYIASGAMDVSLPVWNALWINAEKIDSRLKEEGLQRVRDYKGGLRSNPHSWPEPYKSVYLESHPEA